MENKDAYLSFLYSWNLSMWYLFLAAMALAIIVFFIYHIRYWSTKGLKQKYELASEQEINTYIRVNFIIGVGIFFFANTARPEIMVISPLWFFVRVFVAACLGTLHAYIAYLIFKFYYPGPLNKRLQKLRYTPRINQANGNAMKLLSEDEEDAYLDEGMQAEEDAFSVDYDVWIDEQTGDTLIEKYKGHLSALECDRCGFQTLKLEKEEILSKPTEFSDGEIEKEYKCGYCGRIKRKIFTLTKEPGKDNTLEILKELKNNESLISSIKLEIHASDGETKIYEFQNRKEAIHFLEEFDFSKLPNQS